MVKGADAVARKKNKAGRRKLNNDKSNVSARVASIIAAKKRRLSGKGRKCQGMCFSLPTPDDPFNDRHGKKDEKGGRAKMIPSPQMDKKCFVKGKTAALRKETLGENNGKDEKATRLRYQLKSSSIVNNNLAIKNPIDEGNTKIQPDGKGSGQGHQAVVREITDYPSKFLVLCLNAIYKRLCHEGTYNSDDDKPLFVDPWGLEFLKCYSAGGDILETSGSSCSINQISWMVSIAADTIAKKEENGLSFASPFLLLLVSSQEKAAEVRLMCKPLKALGIHTVSLHPGASLGHQIRGLKDCEPEFLVSTPERLLELVSMKAIDVTGVSFLVIDGLESFYKDGCLDAVKSIRQSISGNLLTVIFNNLFSNICTVALRDIIFGPIHRLSLNPSIPSQSACISQNIYVCSMREEGLPKGIQLLHHLHDTGLCSQPLKALYMVGKDSNFYSLAKILKLDGYPVSTGPNCKASDVDTSIDSDSSMKPVVSVINVEHVSNTDLGYYEIVILPDFVNSIDAYTQILTSMARHTVNGSLHSFVAEQDALLAGPLIQILEQCGQAVPEALRNLHHTSSMMET